ncbi:MAG: gp53-like domain-containing protein [Pseudomonas protegens]
MNAGADDATALTPKKAKWGFSISFGVSGYVAFPSWLGGLIIQWGRTTAASVTFPLQFPNNLWDLTLAVNNHNSSNAINGYFLTTTATSNTGFTAAAPVSNLASAAVLKWYAFGN